MFINDTAIFLLFSGVFMVLAASVSSMTRSYLKKKLSLLEKNTVSTQHLHYIAPEFSAPPPPEEYLAPPPPDQGQAEKPHDYTLKINGQEPQQPKSLFQSTAFKAAGVFIAVIVGYLAYLFVFLPK